MAKRTETKLNLNKETLKALSVEVTDAVGGGAVRTHDRNTACPSHQTCVFNDCYTNNPHACWQN